VAISSTEHAIVKDIGKWRKSKAFLVLEGEKLLREVLASGAAPTLVLTVEGAGLGLARTDLKGAKWLDVTDRVMKKISALSSPTNVLAVVPPPGYDLAAILKRPGPVLLLDGIQDPGNLGAIFRSACAFKAAGIITMNETCRVWQDKVVRASAGMIFHLPFMENLSPERLSELREKGELYVLDAQSGITPGEIPRRPRPILVLGNEGHGPRKIFQDFSRVRIPMERGVESLNAAHALSIVLYALY